MDRIAEIAERVAMPRTAARTQTGWYEDARTGLMVIWAKVSSGDDQMRVDEAEDMVGMASGVAMRLVDKAGIKGGRMDYDEYVGAEGGKLYGISYRYVTGAGDLEESLAGLTREGRP